MIKISLIALMVLMSFTKIFAQETYKILTPSQMQNDLALFGFQVAKLPANKGGQR